MTPHERQADIRLRVNAATPTDWYWRRDKKGQWDVYSLESDIVWLLGRVEELEKALSLLADVADGMATGDGDAFHHAHGAISMARAAATGKGGDK